MKGISSIVTLLLILVIVISIGIFFWSYTNGYFSQLTQTGSNNTQSALQTTSSCIRIEEAYQKKIFIRNCGRGVIEERTLGVYVDEIPVGFVQSPSVIGEGKSGTVTISSFISAGQHLLKINNQNAQSTVQFTFDGSNFRII